MDEDKNKIALVLFDNEELEKSISDMEKLQKIEEVYKEYNILCSECPADRERGECNDCFVYNIEKVLIGE